LKVYPPHREPVFSFIVDCPFVEDSISLVPHVLLSQQRDSGSIVAWYMAEGDMFIEGFHAYQADVYFHTE
jgi:hypothetical protein